MNIHGRVVYFIFEDFGVEMGCYINGLHCRVASNVIWRDSGSLDKIHTFHSYVLPEDRTVSDPDFTSFNSNTTSARLKQLQKRLH